MGIFIIRKDRSVKVWVWKSCVEQRTMVVGVYDEPETLRRVLKETVMFLLWIAYSIGGDILSLQTSTTIFNQTIVLPTITFHVFGKDGIPALLLKETI